MTPQDLDKVFPYICFAYGALASFALNVPTLERLAEQRLPQALTHRWQAHRGIALLSMIVGAVWILENLWLT